MAWHTGAVMRRGLSLVGWLVLLVGCTTIAPPTLAPTEPPTAVPTTAATATPTPSPTEAASPPPTPTSTPIASPTAKPTDSPPPATPAPSMPPPAAVAAELKTRGTLDVCLAIVGTPAAAIDPSGELVGYNVSFAQELAERMGLAVEFQQPLFDELIDLVENHECDLAVSSQNITATRLARVDFAAYTESLQPVLVSIGNPAGIDTLDDLCGKPVSATTGTTHVDFVTGSGDYVGQGLDDACAAAGEQLVDLRTFATEFQAVSALLGDLVVAYLGNPGFAVEYVNQIDYADATLPPARQGITVARDHPVLLTAVHATLALMFADGTYREILVRHLPNDESVAIVSILE